MIVILLICVCVWVFWCFSAATDVLVDYLTNFYNTPSSMGMWCAWRTCAHVIIILECKQCISNQRNTMQSIHPIQPTQSTHQYNQHIQQKTHCPCPIPSLLSSHTYAQEDRHLVEPHTQQPAPSLNSCLSVCLPACLPVCVVNSSLMFVLFPHLAYGWRKTELPLSIPLGASRCINNMAACMFFLR